MRGGRRQAFREIFDNPILVGTITILVVVVAVYLSYIAENGLPFVPTYSVKVQVANAAELVKNADVRIGGARVGQVLTITPEPATKRYPHPYAQLGLSLQKSLEPLPRDTQYQVRLASVLGGKYLELFPGRPGGPACRTAARSRSRRFRGETTTGRSSTSTPRSRRSVRRRSGACASSSASSGTRSPDVAASSTTRSIQRAA